MGLIAAMMLFGLENSSLAAGPLDASAHPAWHSASMTMLRDLVDAVGDSSAHGFCEMHE